MKSLPYWSTMRLIPLLLCLASLVIPSDATGSLRRSKDWVIEVDLSRELQGNQTFQSPEQADDGSDVTLLNRLITLMLPFINAAFQALVPDPLDLSFEETFKVGEIDVLLCKAALDLNIDLGSVLGLSKLSINSLQVVLGTESVEAGCVETLWNAVFDMSVGSSDLFTMDGLAAGFDASACGISVDEKLSGGVNTYQPLLQGQVSISGALTGTKARIDFSKVDGTLEVGYQKVEAFLNGADPALASFLSDSTTILSNVMKDQLVVTVEPKMRSNLEVSMLGEVEVTRREVWAINGGFVRNDLQKRATRMFEGALTFIGFGAGRNGVEDVDGLL
jgi:hypothetical protein